MTPKQSPQRQISALIRKHQTELAQMRERKSTPVSWDYYWRIMGYVSGLEKALDIIGKE